VIDGQWIGEHSHVAVIIIGKANGSGILAVDSDHTAHRIVAVACRVILWIGYGFKESLSIISKVDPPRTLIQRRKPSSIIPQKQMAFGNQVLTSLYCPAYC